MRIRYRLRHPIKIHDELGDVSYDKDPMAAANHDPDLSGADPSDK
jgi:hypothetical protein